MSTVFRLGLTRDCMAPDGDQPGFDARAFAVLDAVPGLTWEFLPAWNDRITPTDVAEFDAIMSLRPAMTAESLSGSDVRLKLLARFGAGYDNVDLAVCDRAGVLVANAPDGVRRPVATTILTFILALSHKLFTKDRLTRTGGWHERTRHMGEGLVGKVVGSVGFGSIAQESFRLLAPLDMVHLATSPRRHPAEAAALNVREVDLDTVLRESDFVCINAPLTPESRHLIGAREIGLMKPSAYLINTGRGPIVDEPALYEALRDRRIAGAALDVFEQEPVSPDNPILKLDNVIVTPHSLCWTDECYRGIAESAFRAIASVANGEIPENLVNPRVLEHPRWAVQISA
ncbi:MAG TPA: NAD(P)-dependent oxidoreductase [Alphaproteobacteria bacterium]|jgi:D-3-phosphoglycerate dehydrogenase|nr:NAD(P)-dependent oxidoreductase [Alphaproteobacteria bacterium]